MPLPNITFKSHFSINFKLMHIKLLSKEIFNGEKAQVKAFLEGFKDVTPLINTASTKEEAVKSLLSVVVMAGDVRLDARCYCPT